MRMITEIYWTPDDKGDSDLIPGHVTRVIKSDHELRIFFAGRDGQYRDQYEGVLRLQLRAGTQTIRGTQSYKELSGEWEPVPFSVVGKFEDARLTSFSGVWTESGASFRVDVLGLPIHVKRTTRPTKVAKSKRRKGA